MELTEVKIGESIEHNDKYDGEGEIIVVEVDDYGVKGVVACNRKYENLNGCLTGISNYELQYFQPV